MHPLYTAMGVLLAFLSGQAIAWVYMFTHNGECKSSVLYLSADTRDGEQA